MGIKIWHMLIWSILVLVGHSHGLKCYVCNSAYDEGCYSSPPLAKYLVECNSNTAKPVFQGVSGDTRNFSIVLDRLSIEDEAQTGLNFTNCRKDDATIPYQYYFDHWKEGTRRIFRSCGWLGKPQNKCKLISNEPIHLIECSCTDDNCNSGQKSQLSPFLVLNLWLISIYISRYFI